MAFVDAYEFEGWKKRNINRVKPQVELENSYKKIVEAKEIIISQFQKLIKYCENEKQLDQITSTTGKRKRLKQKMQEFRIRN